MAYSFNLCMFLISLILWLVHLSEASKAEFVTCGTTVKLLNPDLRLRLHSHDVKYGSGSGQQSVTAVDTSDDHNSYWQVLPAMGDTLKRGTPIKCNSNIRLFHTTTSKHLHSHFFSSPLSGHQEVSCYGEGDSGDHWTVICNNDYWRRDTPVKLKHVDTGMYLAGSGHTFGRPISGQGEVVAVSSPYEAHTDWIVKEGMFVHPSDLLPHQQHAIHSEL